jgi:Raf kinase inhibitor-like YbhB/YbcL family protein
MKLKSNDFEDNSRIPSEFTCDGRNVSPQLSWEDVPKQTKSFALTVTDPDAPGGNWIHWFVYNISKESREIMQASLPHGAKEVENNFGRKPYGGPCPPSGTHRYVFTIYALNTEHLDGINSRNFIKKVEENALEKATIKGLYNRRR